VKFKIERWRREWNELGAYKDVWDEIGTEDVMLDGLDNGNGRNVTIGCKTSGLHLFLRDMFDLNISYHYIELKAFSMDNQEFWHLRLSAPPLTITHVIPQNSGKPFPELPEKRY